MESNLQEAKLELIQWLAAIDDPSIIEQIQAIRDNAKEDWWERVLAIDRELFGKGTEDAEDEDTKDEDGGKV